MGKGSSSSPGTNTNTVVTQQQPPAAWLNAYTNLTNQAQNQAQQPLQTYPGLPQSIVAPFSNQQLQAFNEIGNAQGLSVPFTNAAAAEFGAATQPLWPTLPGYASSLGTYFNPYQQYVTGATQNLFNETNAEQLNSVRGNAAAQGAFGGDREAIAEAETARQQQLGEAPTLAGIQSQGFTQAQQEFNQQQQTQLAAEQANAWLSSQAGFGLGALGTQAEQQALSAAGALGQAGAQQQALEQQYLNIPYEQFIQQQAYPYQQLNWLSGIVEGTGGLAGGQSSTSYPGPSTLSQLGGLGLAGTGLIGATGGFGSNGWLTGAGGLFGSGAVDVPAATAADTAAASGILGSGGSLADVFSTIGTAGIPFAREGGRIGRQSGGSVPGYASAPGLNTPYASIPDLRTGYVQAPPQMGGGRGPPAAPNVNPQTLSSGEMSPTQFIQGLSTLKSLGAFKSNSNATTPVSEQRGGFIHAPPSMGLHTGVRGGLGPHLRLPGGGLHHGFHGAPRVALQGGGMAAPLAGAMPIAGADPNTQGYYQRLTGQSLEQLRELAARIPPGSPTGALIQRAIAAKEMTPGSGVSPFSTAQQPAPGSAATPPSGGGPLGIGFTPGVPAGPPVASQAGGRVHLQTGGVGGSPPTPIGMPSLARAPDGTISSTALLPAQTGRMGANNPLTAAPSNPMSFATMNTNSPLTFLPTSPPPAPTQVGNIAMPQIDPSLFTAQSGNLAAFQPAVPAPLPAPTPAPAATPAANTPAAAPTPTSSNILFFDPSSTDPGIIAARAAVAQANQDFINAEPQGPGGMRGGGRVGLQGGGNGDEPEARAAIPPANTDEPEGSPIVVTQSPELEARAPIPPSLGESPTGTAGEQGARGTESGLAATPPRHPRHPWNTNLLPPPRGNWVTVPPANPGSTSQSWLDKPLGEVFWDWAKNANWRSGGEWSHPEVADVTEDPGRSVGTVLPPPGLGNASSEARGSLAIPPNVSNVAEDPGRTVRTVLPPAGLGNAPVPPRKPEPPPERPAPASSPTTSPTTSPNGRLTPPTQPLMQVQGGAPPMAVPIPPSLEPIFQRESGGNYTAQNPQSSASGIGQDIDSTWREAMHGLGYGDRWAHAKDAPPDIQHAANIWLQGRYGNRPWAASEPKSGQFAGLGQQPRANVGMIRAGYQPSANGPNTYSPPDLSTPPAITRAAYERTPDEGRGTASSGFLSSPWMIPLSIGAGMLASRSPFPGVALGEGLETGIKVAGQEAERQTRGEVAEARIQTAQEAAGRLADRFGELRRWHDMQAQHQNEQLESNTALKQQALQISELTAETRLAAASSQADARTAQLQIAQVRADAATEKNLLTANTTKTFPSRKDPNDPNSPWGTLFVPEHPDPSKPNNGAVWMPIGGPPPGVEVSQAKQRNEEIKGWAEEYRKNWQAAHPMGAMDLPKGETVPDFIKMGAEKYEADHPTAGGHAQPTPQEGLVPPPGAPAGSRIGTAADGKQHWIAPDPNRPGKYILGPEVQGATP